MKRNQWHIERMANIGINAASGLANGVFGTSGRVSNSVQADLVLLSQVRYALSDALSLGVAEWQETADRGSLRTVMRPDLRKAIGLSAQPASKIDQAEQTKASFQAPVQHAFRASKRQLSPMKAHSRARNENNGQKRTLFALANL